MKKSLVLAMAMALGVSATAFAANPFSDLPAGHWAYASVAKLAAAGIVDGYPDGSYKGSKLMTRYEMAQIVAKALAKGAIGADDKLVSEFADELDNLGVRVAKLEKNADNVKVTGQARFHNQRGKLTDVAGKDTKSNAANLRTRLFLTGEVNDDWHYQGMLENTQKFAGEDNGDEATNFQRAFLTGNLFGLKATAGRYHELMDKGYIYEHRVDGLKLVGGNKVKVTGEIGKMANADGKHVAGKFVRAGLGFDLGSAANLYGTYVKVDDVTSGDATLYTGDNKIWAVGTTLKPAKDLKLGFEYLKGDSDDVEAHKGNQSGWVIDAGFKGAKAAKPGSWGLFGNYYNQGAGTTINQGITALGANLKNFDYEGFKGYRVGANVAVAKNMVAEVQYYDLKGKDTENKSKTLWSQFVVTF